MLFSEELAYLQVAALLLMVLPKFCSSRTVQTVAWLGLYAVCAFAVCLVTPRLNASSVLDHVGAPGTANVAAGSYLPSSGGYAVPMTKPLTHAVGPVDMTTPPNSEQQQTVIRDELSRQQLTAARSLMTLSHHPMQPSHSADRLMLSTDSQFATRQPAIPRSGSNVQRSHSFTTTSHQPPTNAGL